MQYELRHLGHYGVTDAKLHWNSGGMKDVPSWCGFLLFLISSHLICGPVMLDVGDYSVV